VVEGETGWVIPPNDPQALANRLERALKDPERLERMGQAGRDWYDRERQIEGETLREMYADMVAERRPGAATGSTISAEAMEQP
jgi:glycosyltransferase involved in cell wall biosynthesis